MEKSERCYIDSYKKVGWLKEVIVVFDVWRNALEEIEQKIPHEAFVTWFQGVKMLSNTDGKIVIGAPNVFKTNQIQQRYDREVREALEHNGVTVSEITYISHGGSTINKRPREITASELSKINNTSKVEQAGTQSDFDTYKSLNNGLKSDYTLDNFVVGTNDVAVSVARNIIEQPGGRFNPFFLYGGPGLGKTHLVQAIGNELARKDPKLKILYTTTSDFYSEFIRSLKDKRADSFTQKYRNLDVLIIDDFQMIINKDASQNAFFDVFNDLHQRNRQIIVTSDRMPDQIKTLDKRLSSRLAMTGPIDMQMPSFEDRCAILRMKAEFMGREIEDEVVEYLAENVKTNIRELEGEFNKILLYSDVRGVRPIELIHSGIISTSQSTRRMNVTPRTIVSKVASEYGLSVEKMCSKSRISQIKTARQVAMYILKEELELSTTKIALEVGVKDHTTVMHGIKKIGQDMTQDYSLRERIEQIRRKIYE